MTSDGEPRQNDRLINMEKRSYEKALFSGDDGMWTIFEIVKKPVAQAPSEPAANRLIGLFERLEKKPA